MACSRRNRRTHGYYSSRRQTEEFRSPNPERIYRSTDDKMFAGVLGGLAERFGWESTVLRLIVVCASVFLAMFGPLLIGYLIAMMVIPKRPTERPAYTSDEETVFWREVSDRPRATFGSIRYKFMDLEERLRNIEANVTSDEWRLRKEFRDLERP